MSAGASADPPANADDLYHDGRAALEAGDVERAVALLRRSAELEPNFNTLALLGETLAAERRWREAIVPLAAVTTLHRDDRAPALLARAFLELGRLAEARDLAQLALERNAANAIARRVRTDARRALDGG